MKGENADAKLLDKAATVNINGTEHKGWVMDTAGGGVTNDSICEVVQKSMTRRWELTQCNRWRHECIGLARTSRFERRFKPLPGWPDGASPKCPGH